MFGFLRIYLRFLSTVAAATTIAMMTTAAIATYISVDSPPVGFGAVVGVDVALGEEVGVAVGEDVGVVVGTAAVGCGASDTPMAVSADDGQ